MIYFTIIAIKYINDVLYDIDDGCVTGTETMLGDFLLSLGIRKSMGLLSYPEKNLCYIVTTKWL